MDSGGGGAPPPAAADEGGRRGADCVYYLASPLTCKKGSECEYRHSDAARANPRDCWYWLNGNCANPKCSFRHPPLDDMLGAQVTPRAPQIPVPAQALASGGAAKPGVPCYYFQKGMCAKGNLCAFSHAPQFAGSPALHQTAAKGFAPAVLQPHLQLKNSNSWVKPNNSAQQSTTPSSIHGEPQVSAGNGKPVQKQNPATRAYYNSSGVYQNHSSSYVLSGAAKSYQPQPSVEDDTAETGEFVREPSAGSSVVAAGSVDDDAERSFKEVQNSYRRTEQNSGTRRQTHGGYELERSHRSSSDRLVSERRLSSSQREPAAHVTANSSDLRHRLLKQRRLNDPRSAQQVSDRQDRRYPEDERDSHHRRRGEERATSDRLSRSRLHGRIKLPGEVTSSLDRLGPYPEKETRPRDRLSPPKQTDLRAKIHDRLKARSNEDVVPGNNNVRSSVVKATSGGEDAANRAVKFSGPKSLAELRAKKFAANSSGEHITRKSADRIAVPVRMMTSEILTNRVSPDPVPFDGPKPLSAILKRKREEAGSADSGSLQDEQIAGEEEQSLKNNCIITENDGTNTEDNEEEEAFHPEDEVMYDDSLSPADDNAAEAAADVGKEELEEGEQQEDVEAAEGEYEYEAADDVNAEEDNDYQEYEDDDDLEDDDDFARKVGVLIS